jgi:hypothetical protein
MWLFIVLLCACNLVSAPPTPTAPPSPTAVPLELLPPTPLVIDPNATPIVSDCAATPLNWIAYTVEAGDSLSLLAEQTRSTVEEIAAGNCLDDADQIQIDTVIFLPRVPVVAP